MPLPTGTRYKVKTYPSGKRVRLAIFNGKVIETSPMIRRKQTRTQRSLKRARRRIRR